MEVFITLVLGLTLLHAFVDYLQIKAHKKINHKLELSIYLGLCISLMIVVFDSYTLMLFGKCLGLTLLTRAAFFDYTLNALRGLSPFYISANALDGYSGKHESWWDSHVKQHANIVRAACLVSYFGVLLLFFFDIL